MTFSAPRVLTLAGAATVVAATLLPCYRFDAVLASGGGPSATPANGAVDLWSIYPLAGALLVIGALVAVVLQLAPGRGGRAERSIAGALGLAIAAWAMVQWFDGPGLARVLAASPRAGVVTGGASAGEGIFIMLVGAAALIFAALEPDPVLPASSEERVPATAQAVAR
jgi:hypothetical protein